MPTPRSATASRRPARTTAPVPSTPAPARAPRPVTPTSGSSCRRAPATASSVAASPLPPRSKARVVTRHVPDVTNPRPVPARAGIGLRAGHFADVLTNRPDVGWFEVHSENHFAPAGAAHAALDALRANYPISLHGVGLSLGGTDPLDLRHIERLSQAIDRYRPALVSEHLCWSMAGGRHTNDLLPLPYTREALR